MMRNTEPLDSEPQDELEYLGDCDWCSQPVYSDQEYEAGDDGAGVMHEDCKSAAEIGHGLV